MDKIVALSFPLTIKVSVYLTLAMIPIIILSEKKIVTNLEFEWMDTTLFLVTNAIFFIRLATHIKATKSA